MPLSEISGRAMSDTGKLFVSQVTVDAEYLFEPQAGTDVQCLFKSTGDS